MRFRIPLAFAGGLAVFVSTFCGPAATAGFGQVALPDLLVEHVKITSLTADKVEFCYKVRNTGNAAANLDGVVVTAALSGDEHADASDTAAGSQTLSGTLPAGQCIYCCCAGMAKINPPETPYLVLCIDPTNAVQESDKSNNCGVGQLHDVFSEPPASEEQPPTLVQRPYPQETIVVRARPAQTIVFEPPHPPTFVFLPQTVVHPRVINMQQPSAPRTIVIGGEKCGIQLPADLFQHKPDCLCVPCQDCHPSPQPATGSVLQGAP